MPTKKQRKRRKKGQRHTYEYVWVDEEGREVEVAEGDDAEEAVRPERAARPTKAEARKAPASGDGRLRAPQPPSIRRVLKRAMIFAPLMYVTVYLLSGDEFTTEQEVAQTFFLLMIFLPFSYAMDAMTYRVWRRRLAKAQGGGRRGG